MWILKRDGKVIDQWDGDLKQQELSTTARDAGVYPPLDYERAKREGSATWYCSGVIELVQNLGIEDKA